MDMSGRTALCACMLIWMVLMDSSSRCSSAHALVAVTDPARVNSRVDAVSRNIDDDMLLGALLLQHALASAAAHRTRYGVLGTTLNFSAPGQDGMAHESKLTLLPLALRGWTAALYVTCLAAEGSGAGSGQLSTERKQAATCCLRA